MSSRSAERSLESCLEWLLGQDAPEAALVAHAAGVAESDAVARRWIGRILADQQTDGSWDGDLVRTAESLLAVHELRSAADVVEQDPGIGRAHDWLRSTRGLPGTWADGCSTERHLLGLCHHFVGGFYSPGSPDEPLEGVRLRCGSRVAGDGEVRLVASVLALRCFLGAGSTGRDDLLHLASLRHLIRVWTEDRPEHLSTSALLATVHALIASPTEQDRVMAEIGLRVVAGKQRGDGSWVDTDPFHALDVIATAAAAGIDSERTRRALWHGARLLVSTQQADGSWGSDHGARRAWIAWRTLRQVEVTGSAD
jgi:hypothetical protein